MRTVKKIIEDYQAKSTLADRIDETIFLTSADIQNFVISEIVAQEKAIRGHLLTRIAKLKAEHKKILGKYANLPEKNKTPASRRMQAIETAIVELKFLMLKNGKLKRDSSYPRIV